jgi:hypothetical protein
MLASTAVTPTTDFTIADSNLTGGGRMVTVAAKPGVEILTTGTAGHIALCATTTLLFVTVASALGELTDGNVVNIPAFKIAVADPTAP